MQSYEENSEVNVFADYSGKGGIGRVNLDTSLLLWRLPLLLLDKGNVS